MSNKESTLIDYPIEEGEVEEEGLLIARRDSIRYKPRKLQIAGVEVISLEQALDVIKDLLEAEKAAAITIFNAGLLKAKNNVEDVILRWKDMVQNGEALGLEGDTLVAYDIQNAAFLKAVKDIEKTRAIS